MSINLTKLCKFFFLMGVFLLPFQHALLYTFGLETIFKPYRIALLLASFLLISSMLEKQKILFDPYGISFILLFLYGLALAFITNIFYDNIVEFSYTTEVAIVIAFGILLYWLATYNILDDSHIEKVFVILSVGLLLSIILSKVLDTPNFSNGRYNALYKNPNQFAFNCVITFNFLLYKVYCSRKPLQIFLFFILTAALAGSVLYSLSNGGLYTLVLVSIYWTVWFIMHKKISYVVGFFFAFAILLMVLVAMNADLTRIHLSTVLSTGGTGRIYIWKAAFKTFLYHPFGLGLGQFRSFFHLYLDADSPAYMFDIALVAHNQYLAIALCLGFPGLMLYIYFLKKILTSLIAMLKQGGAAVHLLPIFIGSIVFDFTQVSYTSPVQWLIWGCIISSMRNNQKYFKNEKL